MAGLREALWSVGLIAVTASDQPAESPAKSMHQKELGHWRTREATGWQADRDPRDLPVAPLNGEASHANGDGVRVNQGVASQRHCTLRVIDHGLDSIDASPVLRDASERIYARFVYWATLDRWEIEILVHHEPDDDEFGMVIVSPSTPGEHDTMIYWIDTDAGEDDGPALPREFALEQNHPNPFNQATTIDYALPADGHVQLEIFDLRGRRVAVLVDGWEEAGHRSAEWIAGSLASGACFARLVAGQFREIRKLVLMK